MHGVRILGFEFRVKWGGERLLLDCLLVWRSGREGGSGSESRL